MESSIGSAKKAIHPDAEILKRENTRENSPMPPANRRQDQRSAVKKWMILREAMMRHGFKSLPEEWWHFTLDNEPYPDTYFTHPVK